MKERHIPKSQTHEVDIERELAFIVRRRERSRPIEKRGPQTPEPVQLPSGRTLLDE
jgi:hypothetical protein